MVAVTGHSVYGYGGKSMITLTFWQIALLSTLIPLVWGLISRTMNRLVDQILERGWEKRYEDKENKKLADAARGIALMRKEEANRSGKRMGHRVQISDIEESVKSHSEEDEL